MTKFNDLYKMIVENMSPRLWIDQDGNSVTQDQLYNNYKQLLSDKSIDQTQTFQQFIQSCESKNGSLTRADSKYVTDSLVTKLNMSYKTWQDANQILFLKEQANGWGRNIKSNIENPERQIEDILNNYFDTNTYQGHILGGPQPNEYLKIIIYCSQHGFELGFPEKDTDKEIIDELYKSTSNKQQLQTLLNYYD